MLSLREIENFLQRTPPHLQEIVYELRNIIASVAPDACEVIRWGGLSYYHEGRGGLITAGICQIAVYGDKVWLGFIHGVHLPDPRHLMDGQQKSKRYVRIQSFDDAPWEDLTRLIQAAAEFDPRTLKN